MISNQHPNNYIIKEWWLNIYDHKHHPCMFRHDSRRKAIDKKMTYAKPLYRIHVRLK